MQYLLKDATALQLAEKAAEHLGVPYDLQFGIYTTDPRLCAIIEALAGEAYTPAPWLENVSGLLKPNSGGLMEVTAEPIEFNVKLDPDAKIDRVELAEKTEALIGRPVKRVKTKPATRPRPMCEICGTRPTTSNHAKICSDPACKLERQKRYSQESKARLLGKPFEEQLVDQVPASSVAESILAVMRAPENDINSELEPEPNPFPYPAGVQEEPAIEYPLPVERLERTGPANLIYQTETTAPAASMTAEAPTISTVNLMEAPDSWTQTEPWWILSGHQAGMTMTSKLMRDRVRNGTLEPGTRLRNIWRGDYLVQAAAADHPRRVVQVGTGQGMPSRAEAE